MFFLVEQFFYYMFDILGTTVSYFYFILFNVLLSFFYIRLLHSGFPRMMLRITDVVMSMLFSLAFSR